MTRGTFAFIADAQPEKDAPLQMIVSQQYNGGMAPDMTRGIKFGGRLFRNVETCDQFLRLCFETAADLDYTEEATMDEYMPKHSAVYLIDENSKENPFVMVNIVKKDGFQDFDKNPYSTIFHYADFVYMKNMSSKPVFFKDADEKVFCMAPAQSKILCFGHQLEEEEWKQFCRELDFKFGKETNNG